MSCEIIRPAAFHRPDPDDPPPAPGAALPLPPAHFRRREYSIFCLARLLGIYERTTRDGRVRHAADRTIVRHIRALIETAGLPAPVGIRIRRGRDAAGRERSAVLEGAAAVDMRSRWDAAAVDAWFAGRLSPRERAMHDRAEATHAALELDANAARLFAGGRA